ncbi:MAG: hypothetical protein KGH75_00110 [Rhodospirillales bacterium]|nr:hypothetical protein [Rhodospirillales bacterium]
MPITADEVTARLRAYNESVYGQPDDTGFDYVGWNVPTFTSQEQVDRFLAMTFRITSEHETRNGVYWEGTVTFDGATFDAENRGDGGCNWYYGDSDAEQAAKMFAAQVLPDTPEALDTLLTARESYGLATGTVPA